MSSETSPSSTDPFYGNAASDLMREAAGAAAQPPTDPRAWHPPTPQELQAWLPGYAVEAFVARGGMGAVYLGVQTSLERPVAIKILPPQLREIDPSFAQRFKQEARAMAQLNHPSIVSVYDSGEMADGTMYFIMEFVDGTDVAQMVQRKGRLSSANAMAITAHVCDALQYAHENGVVHRDIKPANIMVSKDGRVKVADFGLAKSSRVTATSLTMTGHVMGTPHFLAPEALTLGSSVDHRADIYAVGVMLYQMLTGKLPQGVFEMPSLLVPGLDPRYDQIITAAMREDRAARYQAILDMRRALDAILTQPVERSEVARQTVPPEAAVQTAPAGTAPPKPVPRPGYYRPPQPVKPASVVKTKHSGGMWTVAAVIALVLGGAAWVLWGTKTPPPAQATEETSSPATALAPSPVSSTNLADTIIFPICQFSQASVSEALEYFTTKSRDLDPAKNGVTILAPDSVRGLPVRITMDCRDRPLSELLDYLAHLARLHVTQNGSDIALTTSSKKPPFPKGSPTASQQRFSQVILPMLQFNRANLDEAVEYVRIKGSEISKEHLHVIIDPSLDATKHPISLSVPRVSVTDSLEEIAMLGGAEVVHVQNAFYLQPASSPPIKLPAGGQPELGAAGKVILPSMTFQNASIAEAVDFLRIKSRDLDPQKTGIRIMIDESTLNHPARITVDARDLTFERAVVQIATLAGADMIPLHQGVWLRAQPGSAPVPPMASTPAPVPAGSTQAPDLRVFTNRQGQQLRATVLRVQNDDVTLKREDGQEFTLKAATLSDADIDYLKTQGLVMTVMPGSATPPPHRPVPAAPPPASSTRVVRPTEMALKSPWIPPNVHTRKEWLAALEFYSREVVKSGSSTPSTLWGTFTWLMPLSQATANLPRGSYKLRSDSATPLAFPQGINFHMWHVGGKGFTDDGEHFDEIVFITDDADRLVSIQLSENNLKLLNWNWRNKTIPDGERNPYYNFLHDRSNSKNGRVVQYQFRPAAPGVTNVKIVLEGSESNHWYLSAPLADKLIEISKTVNP